MIRDNRIMFNDAFDEGGGILVGGELGIGGPNGNGSGAVVIERNLVEQNLSNDDGGGVEVLNALTFRDRAAQQHRRQQRGDGRRRRARRRRLLGRAVRQQHRGPQPVDRHRGGQRRPCRTAAAWSAHPFTPAFRATLGPGAPTFPNVVMFNNIFWENRAFTFDAAAENGLADQGVIDLEVVGSASTFTPRWSLLTVPHGTPSGSNLIGQDPLVREPVRDARPRPARTDDRARGSAPGGRSSRRTSRPTRPATITFRPRSPAIDRGVRCSNTAFPAPAGALNPCTGGGVAAPSGLNEDIDLQYRPMLRTLRVRTPWDLGADELVGVPVILP